MLHGNPELRETGLSGLLLDMTLPEIYFATTISEFQKERKTVKPTGYLRSFGCTFRVGLGGADFFGRAIIYFFDVRYWTLEHTTNYVSLEDHTSRMLVGLYNPKDHYKHAKEQGLNSGDIVQMAAVLYDQRSDSGQLAVVEKHLNIPIPDLSKASIEELIPALGFPY